MSFTVPNRWRVRTHPTLGTADDAGHNGAFDIPLIVEHGSLFVIASDGSDVPPPHQWEHVSVHVRLQRGDTRLPTWDEMCRVKRLFWAADDVVVQFHPAEADYVNRHPHVLHLWRSVNQPQPTPPKEFV